MQDGIQPERRSTFLLVLGVTTIRVPLAIVFCIFYLTRSPDLVRVLVGLALLLLIEASDLTDGALARSRGVVSELGAMLDPYTDSFSRLVVYWTLAAAGDVLLITPLILALRDITVSYCRIVLTRRGRSVRANMSGKIKAIVQGTAACFAVAMPVLFRDDYRVYGIVLSWIVILVTATSVLQYVRAAVRAFNAPREDGA